MPAATPRARAVRRPDGGRSGRLLLRVRGASERRSDPATRGLLPEENRVHQVGVAAEDESQHRDARRTFKSIAQRAVAAQLGMC